MVIHVCCTTLQGETLKEILQQLAEAARQAKSPGDLERVKADVKFAQQVQMGWKSEARQLVQAALTAVLLRGVQLQAGR
jgi:hypothetical protein